MEYLISVGVSLLFAVGFEIVKKSWPTGMTVYKVSCSVGITILAFIIAVAYANLSMGIVSAALTVCALSTWLMEGPNINLGFSLFGLAYILFAVSQFHDEYASLLVFAGTLIVFVILYIIAYSHLPAQYRTPLLFYMIGLSVLVGFGVTHSVLLPVLISVVISDGVLAIALFVKDFKFRDFLGISSFAFTSLILPVTYLIVS